MPKSTSQAEAMFNNEPIVLADIKLRLSVGISQIVPTPSLPGTIEGSFLGDDFVGLAYSFMILAMNPTSVYIFTWFFLYLLICHYAVSVGTNLRFVLSLQYIR